MTELFSLGSIFPSDFLKPDEQPRCEPIELKLIMDSRGFVRLSEIAPKEVMWGEKYWYRSSISNTMKNQLKDVVDSILSVFTHDNPSRLIWADIAGNDGYLLSQVPNEYLKINIDPANDSFKNDAIKVCDLVIQDYFSAEAYKKSKYGMHKAGIITAISMLYDLPDPHRFLYDVREVLADDGLFVAQLSYSPLMIKQLEISNVCHEHIYYYSFENLKDLFEESGFSILDAQLNNTNAGSIRIFAMKNDADKSKFASQTHRDVSQYRMDCLLSHEKEMGIDTPRVWRWFFKKVEKLKKEVMDFILVEKQKGKVIMGYGASTKFNTVAQYFGLNNDLITAIADRSEAKHGLYCIGSNIPIISEEKMRAEQPDYLLIGPTHFLSEFIDREDTFLQRGGRFICIMPEFKIISKNVNS